MALKKQADVLRDDEKATHGFEEEVESDVSTDREIIEMMKGVPHNLSSESDSD